MGRSFRGHSQKDFANKFQRLWVITNINKLRSFQYQLLHYAIVTNEKLNQYNSDKLPLCTFCGREVETILHLFCECAIVKRFYRQVLTFINETVLFAVMKGMPTYAELIFNGLPKDAKIVSNLIWLMAKYYVCYRRCTKTDLNIEAFKALVLYVRKMERFKKVV